MCGVKVTQILSTELSERPRVDDTVLQQMLWTQCFKKDENDWMKKCIVHEVEGSRPRSRAKKTWREIAKKD